MYKLTYMEINFAAADFDTKRGGEREIPKDSWSRTYELLSKIKQLNKPTKASSDEKTYEP